MSDLDEAPNQVTFRHIRDKFFRGIVSEKTFILLTDDLVDNWQPIRAIKYKKDHEKDPE